MSINKSYAVFGLGRYGLAVASGLVQSGAEVLAVDQDEAIVNAASTTLPLMVSTSVRRPSRTSA